MTDLIGFNLLSKNLHIREFDQGDRPALQRITHTPGFKFFSLDPNDPDTEQKYINKCLGNQVVDPATGIRDNFRMAITYKDAPDNCIGYVSFGGFSKANEAGNPETGLFVDPAESGKSIGLEATMALVTFVLAKPQYHDIARVWFTTHPDNTAVLAMARLLNGRKNDTGIIQEHDPIENYQTAHGPEPRRVFSYERKSLKEPTRRLARLAERFEIDLS